MKKTLLAALAAMLMVAGAAWYLRWPAAAPAAPVAAQAPVAPAAAPAVVEDGASRTAFLAARAEWLQAREDLRQRIPQADFLLPETAHDENALAAVVDDAALAPQEWLAWRERAAAVGERYRALLPQVAPWQAATAAAEREKAAWLQLATAEALGTPPAAEARDRQLAASAGELARAGRFTDAAAQQQARNALFHDLVGAGTAVPPHRSAAAAQRQRWQALGEKTEPVAETLWQRARAEAASGAFVAATTSFDLATREFAQAWRAARLRAALPAMVEVPAGRFRMGDLQGAGQRDEKPVHEVSVARFALAVDEVTVAQYAAYAELTGRRAPAATVASSQPVTNISWSEARDYAAWLSQVTGDRYRLPTESEWEYAARAGSEAPYASGDKLEQGVAVCEGCSGWGNKSAQPVGGRRANAFGLRDMQGNVWEWVEDCYRPGYAADAAPDCGQHVLRGGSWADLPTVLRVSNRSPVKANFSSDGAGFRVASDR